MLFASHRIYLPTTSLLLMMLRIGRADMMEGAGREVEVVVEVVVMEEDVAAQEEAVTITDMIEEDMTEEIAADMEATVMGVVAIRTTVELSLAIATMIGTMTEHLLQETTPSRISTMDVELEVVTRTTAELSLATATMIGTMTEHLLQEMPIPGSEADRAIEAMRPALLQHIRAY